MLLLLKDLKASSTFVNSGRTKFEICNWIEYQLEISREFRHFGQSRLGPSDVIPGFASKIATSNSQSRQLSIFFQCLVSLI